MGLLNFLVNIIVFLFVSHIYIEIFLLGGIEAHPPMDRSDIDLNRDIEEDLYRVGGSISVFENGDGFFFRPNIGKH